MLYEQHNYFLCHLTFTKDCIITTQPKLHQPAFPPAFPDMSARNKRAGDSPCSDGPSVPAKKKNKQPPADDLRVPLDRLYEAYVHPESADLLRQASTEEEYCFGLEYFWAQLFLHARDYNSEERQELFQRTIPRFAGDKHSEKAIQLAEYFDEVYHTYQSFFLEKISTYSARWLLTESGKEWADARAFALRKKTRGIHVPPHPAHSDELVKWNGKRGLDWGLTQCTDFWLICLRALKTAPAVEGQVRWFSMDQSGDVWYKELSQIALELVRTNIVACHGRQRTMLEVSRETRIFNLRRVMSPNAEKLKAVPRKLFGLGRSLQPPPALASVEAAPQGGSASSRHVPSFDPEQALRFKADLAQGKPFPASSITAARSNAEAPVAEQKEAFKAIFETETERGETPLSVPGGIDLPTEFFNPDNSIFTPRGDYLPTDSDQYVTDFAVAFARAPIWEKANLWDEYLAMEIARVDSAMILAMNRRKALVEMREQAEKDYDRWRIRREALEESYRQIASENQKIVDLKKAQSTAVRGPIAPPRTGNRFLPPQSLARPATPPDHQTEPEQPNNNADGAEKVK
ncbi:hypothetical protein BZA77DRAFT_143524 [Pyronema omphalodes]|nr:hypothetical protein BZA77DRAFT_143524 [Pyronema omphalodes]